MQLPVISYNGLIVTSIAFHSVCSVTMDGVSWDLKLSLKLQAGAI